MTTKFITPNATSSWCRGTGRADVTEVPSSKPVIFSSYPRVQRNVFWNRTRQFKFQILTLSLSTVFSHSTLRSLSSWNSGVKHSRLLFKENLQVYVKNGLGLQRACLCGCEIYAPQCTHEDYRHKHCLINCEHFVCVSTTKVPTQKHNPVTIYSIWKKGKKVKLSHYRHGEALWAPGGWSSQNFYTVGTRRWHALRTGRLYLLLDIPGPHFR
jgi:hypothetical protein